MDYCIIIIIIIMDQKNKSFFCDLHCDNLQAVNLIQSLILSWNNCNDILFSPNKFCQPVVLFTTWLSLSWYPRGLQRSDLRWFQCTVTHVCCYMLSLLCQVAYTLKWNDMKFHLLGLTAFTNTTTPQQDVFEAAGCCHGAEPYNSLCHH